MPLIFVRCAWVLKYSYSFMYGMHRYVDVRGSSRVATSMMAMVARDFETTMPGYIFEGPFAVNGDVIEKANGAS